MNVVTLHGRTQIFQNAEGQNKGLPVINARHETEISDVISEEKKNFLYILKLSEKEAKHIFIQLNNETDGRAKANFKNMSSWQRKMKNSENEYDYLILY